MDSPGWSITMAVPSLLTCALIWLFAERDAIGTLGATTITGWVLFNVFWIMGDFTLIPHGALVAKLLATPTLMAIYAFVYLFFRHTEGGLRILESLRRVRLPQR